MFSKKFLTFFTVLFLVVVLVMAGYSSVMAAGSDLDKIKKNGKIVLGTAADYPPYEFHKQIGGKDTIVGFDIEIAKVIAEDLGVELEIKDMKFDGLLAALQAGNIDFIIAGMVPKEERKKSVDFSIQYYAAEQKFLVKAGEGSKYQEMEDLKELKLGVQKATIQEDIAKEKIGATNVKSISKITDLVMELKYNKIEGIILVKPVADSYAKANDDLEVADVSLGKEDGVAVAVRKGSAELLAEINKTLDKLLATNKVSEFISEATKLAESN